MAPAFVAAATTVTQSQNLKVSAPDLLMRLWDSLSGELTGELTQPLSGTLAELYAQIAGSDPTPTPLSQSPSAKDRLTTALLTNRVERDFSKPELLELYLNVAPYGRGAYGARDGAQAWFGTSIADLNVGQAAFLAAWLAPASVLPAGVVMLSDIGPTDAGPAGIGLGGFDGPSSSDLEQTTLATQARNAVLFAMYEADAITADELEAARAQTLDELLLPRQPSGQVELLRIQITNEHVINELAEAGMTEVLAAVRAELLDNYGERAVNLGGLHVVTTIDLPYQLAAASYVNSVPASPDSANTDAATASSSSGTNAGDGSQTQLIVLDDTGGVRAAVGDAFNAEFAAQELLGQELQGLLPPGRASARSVAKAFSVLSHEGELRLVHLVLSVSTAPPLELLLRNTDVRAQLLTTAENANDYVNEIERHAIKRESVFSLATAKQLSSEHMQPFAQISVSELGGELDLPIVARVITETLSAGAGPTEAGPAGAGLDESQPTGIDYASHWIVGWSDQVLIAAHSTSGVASGPDQEGQEDAAEGTVEDPGQDPALIGLVATFSELMQELHYWPLPTSSSSKSLTQ